MKPQTNTATLVESQLLGEVTSPELSGSVYTVTRDGLPFVPVGCGGIHYNVTVGMPVFGWAADQAQPGVSLENPDPAANVGLSVFACVGNRAVVRSGPAAGAVGVVTGKHEQFDTFQHVLVDFPQPVIELLVPGDKVAIASVGVGLQIPELPSVTFHSLGPQLWERWAVAMVGGRLEVPVVVTLPPKWWGSGAGGSVLPPRWRCSFPTDRRPGTWALMTCASATSWPSATGTAATPRATEGGRCWSV